MNPNQIDLTKLSLTELKALAFDVRETLITTQNNWRLVAEELQRRTKEQGSQPVSSEILQ